MLTVKMFYALIEETIIWSGPYTSKRYFFWEYKFDDNDWVTLFEYGGPGGTGSSRSISKILPGANPGKTCYCKGGWVYNQIKHYTFNYTDVCPYPKCFVKPAEKIYSNYVALHCGIYFDSLHSMTLYYKIYPFDDPSNYSIAYAHLGTQSGTKWHTFYKSNLQPNRKYAFYSLWSSSFPQTFSEILTFTLPTMSYKFRAFGVKPNQENVYGEYKYFERE